MVEPGFNEHDPGDACDGMTMADFVDRFGTGSWEEDPFGVTFPGGETLAAFHFRVGSTVRRLADEHPEATIVVLLAGHLLARTRIEVRRDYLASRRAAINRQELQQVLVNLMVNAIHAMPDGGTLTLRTRDWEAPPVVEGDPARPGIVIEVLDTGPGLSAELLRELFQPFVTRKKDGTGLGLWISRGIVERYGGDIRAANHAAGGAVMSVWLLCEEVPPAAESGALRP